MLSQRSFALLRMTEGVEACGFHGFLWVLLGSMGSCGFHGFLWGRPSKKSPPELIRTYQNPFSPPELIRTYQNPSHQNPLKNLRNLVNLGNLSAPSLNSLNSLTSLSPRPSPPLAKFRKNSYICAICACVRIGTCARNDDNKQIIR